MNTLSILLNQVETRSSRWLLDTPRQLQASRVRVLMGVILLIAFAIRLWEIDKLPLWYDEAYSYYAAKYNDLWRLLSVPFDVHPPLYYALQHIFLPLGEGEFQLRFLSAVIGTATVWLMFLIGREIAGPVSGLAAAGALALTTAHIEYSQEARSYTLVILTLALAVYGLILYWRTQRPANGSATTPEWADVLARPGLWLYGIGALLSLYSHMIALFFLVAINAVLLPKCWPLQNLKQPQLVAWISINLVALAVWLPWGYTLLTLPDRSFQWLHHYSPVEAASSLVNVHGPSYLNGLDMVLHLGFVALIGLGVLIALIRRRTTLVTLLLALLALAPLLLWLIGFVKPVYMLRTVLPSMIGGALALGIAAAFIRHRAALIGLSGVIFIASLMSFGDFKATQKKQDWDKVTAFLEANTGVNDAVLICANTVYLPFHYYAAPAPYTVFTFNIFHNFIVETEFDRALAQSQLPIKYRFNQPTEEARRMIDPVGRFPNVASIGAAFDTVWVVRSQCGDKRF
ncbi:MAG: glycosyltransferase family 39 protein, partial [Pseudomonadota bacterium]